MHTKVKIHVDQYWYQEINSKVWCLIMKLLDMQSQVVTIVKSVIGTYKNQTFLATKSTHHLMMKCYTWKKMYKKELNL